MPFILAALAWSVFPIQIVVLGSFFVCEAPYNINILVRCPLKFGGVARRCYLLILRYL